MKVNWPAIWVTLVALILVGVLLGALSDAPDGRTIECPSLDRVEVSGGIAYCAE